jgi:hypothetical protein
MFTRVEFLTVNVVLDNVNLMIIPGKRLTQLITYIRDYYDVVEMGQLYRCN